MILQNIIYPQTGICTEENLYMRRTEKTFYTLDRDTVFVKEGGSVQFDTYFNGFSIDKWLKYTQVKSVFLTIRARGDYCVTIMQKERLSDETITKCLAQRHIAANDKTQEHTFELQPVSDRGMLFFSIYGVNGDTEFYGGYFAANTDGQERRIKIGAVICTYKREAYIIRNLKLFGKYFFTNELNDIIEIFISDNGKSLTTDIVSDSKIHLIPNKNTGGAGGFARGIIEILENPSYGITHILLMDDDVVINPESVLRTVSLLSVIKPQYEDRFIGGSMLRSDKQFVQHESGGIWDRGLMRHLKHGLNMSDADACLVSEYEENCEYNAWWYCVFPVEHTRDNLPLPLFFQFDDIEYGLRSGKRPILMNGICVWHEPFDNKHAPGLVYYIWRNRLIINAALGIQHEARKIIKDMFDRFIRELVCLRYNNAELLLMGVHDFMQGAGWLMSLDDEENHKKITAMGYKLQQPEEIGFSPNLAQLREVRNINDKGRLVRIFRRITLNGLFFRADKTAVVYISDARPIHFYRAHTAVYFEALSSKAFVTHRDSKRAMSLLAEYMRLRTDILQRYDKVCEAYRMQRNEMVSLKYWKQKLGI